MLCLISTFIYSALHNANATLLPIRGDAMPFGKGPGVELHVPPATGLQPGGGPPPAEPRTPPAPSEGWSSRAATDAVPPPQRCEAGAPGSVPRGRQPPPLHIWHFARWSLVLHTRAHACNRHASPPAPLPAAHPLLSSSISTAATARRPRQGAIVALLRRLIKATVRAGTP